VEDRHDCRGAGEGGFTLAELLTAIVVIGIGVFGTMQLFLGSLHATAATTARSRAVGIAGHEVDVLRATTWPALGFDPAVAPPDPPEGATVTVDPAVATVQPSGPDQVVAGITYHVARGVVWVAVGGDDHAEKRVLVTVTWHDETADHVVREDGLVGPDQSTTTTSSATVPDPPTGPAASVDTGWPNSRIDLSWTGGGSASSWEVEHALDAGFTSPVADTASLPAATTGFVAAGLSPGTTYWFRVRGRSGGAVSTWSTPVSATTTGVVTGTCRIGAVHVSPAPATVDLGTGVLDAAVTVEVEAQGTCPSLSVALRPDDATDISRVMTVTAGGAWQAQVEADLSPVRWATGARQVDVLDGTGATLASASITVCATDGSCAT